MEAMVTEQEKNEYRHHVSVTMADALHRLGQEKLTLEEVGALIDEYDAKSIDNRQHEVFMALRELAAKVHQVNIDMKGKTNV